MVNELINKLTLDTEKINQEYNNCNLSNSISNVINKIKSSEALTEEEFDIFKNISSIDLELTDVEKETLGFIEFLISINDKLDEYQIALLDKLLDKYKVTDTDLVQTKLDRNKRLIEALKSKDLFADFDYLYETLKQYNYSNKEILILIKGLIKSNYGNYDKLTITLEEVSNEITDDIENVEVKEKLSKQEIDNLKRLLKKYQVNSSIFREDLLKYLPIEKDMFKDAEAILEFLNSEGVDIKKLYKKLTLDLIFVLAFGKKEYTTIVKEICEKNKIDLKSILRTGVVVFADYRSQLIDDHEEYFGLHENFLENIEFFNSLGYDHSKCDNIELYYMMNKLCRNCYKLFKDEYRLKLKNPQDIERIFSNRLGNSLDRTLELKDGQDRLIDNYIKYVGTASKRSYYYIREHEQPIMVPAFQTSLANSITGVKIVTEVPKDLSDVFIPEFKETKEEIELYKYFESFIDQDGEQFYAIPLEIAVDHSLEENEYIKFLDEKYRKGRNLYVIADDTRVSRVKVLRVLSLFKQNGIDLTEDKVKFAMKFDLIGYQSDIYNINNAFNEMKKERTKKLC